MGVSTDDDGVKLPTRFAGAVFRLEVFDCRPARTTTVQQASVTA
jgi:hypothetical protein